MHPPSPAEESASEQPTPCQQTKVQLPKAISQIAFISAIEDDRPIIGALDDVTLEFAVDTISADRTSVAVYIRYRSIQIAMYPCPAHRSTVGESEDPSWPFSTVRMPFTDLARAFHRLHHRFLQRCIRHRLYPKNLHPCLPLKCAVLPWRQSLCLLECSKIMPLHYLLLVNKQGQTRLAKYYEYFEMEERVAMEGEIVRRCLARNNTQVCGDYESAKCYYCMLTDPVFIFSIQKVPHNIPQICFPLFHHCSRSNRCLFSQLFFWHIITYLQNELAILEFIHNLVETFDRYFDNVVC